jgi:DNA-directed RNA polymerase specialized sigma24 family protein
MIEPAWHTTWLADRSSSAPCNSLEGWGVRDDVMTKGQEYLSVTDLPVTVAELYQLQRLPMARLAFVLTGSSSFADEIVQEAFLKVHVNWSSIENPGGYLRTAVVNGCRSYHRHQAVVDRTYLSPPVHATLVHRELDDALAKLPYRRRAALALRYFCDLPDAEIALALGPARPSVRWRSA